MWSIAASIALVAAGFTLARFFPPRVAAQAPTDKPLASALVRAKDAVPTRGDWGEWRRYFRGQTWHLDGKEWLARKGDVVYAAPWTMHGLKNTGDAALTYYMVKWNGKGVKAPEKPVGGRGMESMPATFEVPIVEAPPKPGKR
jgi:hypothetical protein